VRTDVKSEPLVRFVTFAGKYVRPLLCTRSKTWFPRDAYTGVSVKARSSPIDVKRRKNVFDTLRPSSGKERLEAPLRASYRVLSAISSFQTLYWENGAARVNELQRYRMENPKTPVSEDCSRIALAAVDCFSKLPLFFNNTEAIKPPMVRTIQVHSTLGCHNSKVCRQPSCRERVLVLIHPEFDASHNEEYSD
jgi:hypothetical protein